MTKNVLAAHVGRTGFKHVAQESDTDRYASSASEVPEEMIKDEYKLGSLDDNDEVAIVMIQSDDSQEKIKKFGKTLNAFRSLDVDRCQLRSKLSETLKEKNVLSRFSKPSASTLVESGFKTAHHDARVKKLEIASCFLHLTILLFSFGYVSCL